MQKMIGTYSMEGNTVEYAITGQEGEPVLVMHGGHSNCNEKFGYHALIQSGFKIITPSRAGYGRTSKEIGDSLSQACRYYVELLNHLEVEKVHVLAISAGGPSGLYLAAHYPERVKTLTLQSAVTKAWHKPESKTYKLAQVLFHPYLEKLTWKLTSTMSNCFPMFMFKQMAPSFSNLSHKAILDKVTDKDIDEVRKMNNRQRSRHGFLIDLSQTNEITAKDMQSISSSTLIMHSKHDGAVSLQHVYYAHQQIRPSKVCILESWGHLIWLGIEAEGMEEKLIHFLTNHSEET